MGEEGGRGSRGSRKFRSETPLTRREKAVSGAVGTLAVGAGIVAVFWTGNEVGSATLLAVGVYFVVTAFLGRFPRLIIAGTEVDPRKLEEVEEDADAAKVNSEDVKEGLADARERIAALEAAIAILETALVASQSLPPQSPPPPTEGEALHIDERLARLALDYNEVRWTMPSGDERTMEMTGIVDRMIAVSQETEVPNVEALLTSDDRGLRLAGIAYLNARPDSAPIRPLAKVALEADKPFNEYWGLLTLRKVLRGHCDLLDATLRRQLHERLRALPPGSDRSREIRGIFDDCP